VLTAREHRLRQVELRVNERNTAPGRRRPI